MQWTWPDNKSFAFFLSFDFEANTPALLQAEKDYVALKRGEAGLKAIPRLMDVMASCGTKTTFFITTWLIEHHPDILNDIISRGHEIGCHGYMHEHLTQLSAGDERAVFEKSDALCKGFFKQPVSGFRAPYWRMNERTLDFISEFGFKYDSCMMDSDSPYILMNDPETGPIAELPVSVYMDDYPRYEMNGRSPAEFRQMVCDEVDAVKKRGSYMSLSMHPWVENLDSRLDALKGMIEYAQENGAFISTGRELAAAVVNNLT